MLSEALRVRPKKWRFDPHTATECRAGDHTILQSYREVVLAELYLTKIYSTMLEIVILADVFVCVSEVQVKATILGLLDIYIA